MVAIFQCVIAFTIRHFFIFKGQIQDPFNGKIYQAKHTLSSEDLVLISHSAIKIWRYDKHVEWTEGAIEVAEKLEGNQVMVIRKLKRYLKTAIQGIN